MTKEAPQEELEEVFLAVVEPILNSLQIHREVIFGHASVNVQWTSQAFTDTLGVIVETWEGLMGNQRRA